MVDPWRRKPLPRDLPTKAASERYPPGTEVELSELHSGSGNDVKTRKGPDSEEESAGLLSDPRGVPAGNAGQKKLRRHLTLTDLLSIGVGGTVGSGIFAVSGLVARQYSGPAVSLSWLFAGVAASLNGVCYAELAGRIPAEGSAYCYAYVSMGELAAVVAAACLTLEFGVSGAAVARSWGDKVVVLLRSEAFGGIDLVSHEWIDRFLQPGNCVNPMAFLLSALCVCGLLAGVRESKAATNFFTVTKLVLVAFMTVGGFLLFRATNLKPFIPPEYGLVGVFRGATSSFFGYVGFDEACCLAGEALHPSRDMPRAVLLTIACVTALYVLAALALTGMQPYTDIDPSSGFPEAFRANGINWAARVTGFGEIFTMPVVVLIALLAQPRLQYALAMDGLLPSIFAELDNRNNLRKGTLISGTGMTLLATFVPFKFLDDLISSGILLAFCISDGALILLRRESPRERPLLLPKLLGAYNLTSFAASVLLSNSLDSFVGIAGSVAFCTMAMILCWCISSLCPPSARFGNGLSGNDGCDSKKSKEGSEEDCHFQCPFVPYFPCLGIFVNWYLISQLEAKGLVLLAAYIGLATTVYVFSAGCRRET
mmetsp:Transcript_35565/g.106147  ORF Transcript_35565/g.106147 Transcript_35565/m.106147 type:complete len:597 (-) Transcript_35565:68-1858(-)